MSRESEVLSPNGHKGGTGDSVLIGLTKKQLKEKVRTTKDKDSLLLPMVNTSKHNPKRGDSLQRGNFVSLYKLGVTRSKVYFLFTVFVVRVVDVIPRLQLEGRFLLLGCLSVYTVCRDIQCSTLEELILEP